MRKKGTEPNVPASAQPTIADLALALKEAGCRSGFFVPQDDPAKCGMHLPPRSACGKSTKGGMAAWITLPDGEGEKVQASILCRACGEELQRELERVLAEEGEEGDLEGLFGGDE